MNRLSVSESKKLIFDVVIPARDEEGSIAACVREIPAETASGQLRHVIVADNGSRDRTAELAKQAGAIVVYETEPGYGAACLKALSSIEADPPDVVVFIDGDLSDDPSEVELLLCEVKKGADLVIGSRVRGELERGALTPVQRFGNAVACTGLRVLYGAHFSDLGPFRALRYESLEALKMSDRNWGWTVEMQIRAALVDLQCAEVPVSYRRRRTGRSKVSGTVVGSVSAGTKILFLLAKHRIFSAKGTLTSWLIELVTELGATKSP